MYVTLSSLSKGDMPYVVVGGDTSTSSVHQLRCKKTPGNVTSVMISKYFSLPVVGEEEKTPTTVENDQSFFFSNA